MFQNKLFSFSHKEILRTSDLNDTMIVILGVVHIQMMIKRFLIKEIPLKYIL